MKRLSRPTSPAKRAGLSALSDRTLGNMGRRMLAALGSMTPGLSVLASGH